MIKDVFVLSKNAWHSKLMKYIWNLNYRDFSHMCPYFWLSVFNVIAFVPVFIGKSVIGKIFTYSRSRFGDYLEKKEKQWALDYIEKLKNDPKELVKLSRLSTKKYNDILYYRNLNFSSLGSNFWKELYRLRDSYNDELSEKYEIKSYRKEEKSLTNKERINKLLKVVKPISKAILYIISAAGLFGVGMLLMYLFILLAGIPGSDWLNFATVIGYCIVAIICFLLLCGGIYLIKEHINENIKNGFVTFFSTIAQSIGWLVKKIIGAVSFLVMMLKDSCPAINWKD